MGSPPEELRPRELDHRDATFAVVLGVRAVKPTPEWTATIVGRWQYGNAEPCPDGDDVTYRKGMAFLDGHGTIEDWGAGTGYARRFVDPKRVPRRRRQPEPRRRPHRRPARAIARTPTASSCATSSSTIPDWRTILENALRSFRRRMVLVVFTPFAAETHEIALVAGHPRPGASARTIWWRHFEGSTGARRRVETNTEYLREHVFYLERRSAPSADGVS